MAKKTYKVLSVRIALQDIASAIELCDSHNLPTTGQSGAIAKAISLVFESLRENGTLQTHTDSSAITFIEARYDGRSAGKLQIPKIEISPKEPAPEIEIPKPTIPSYGGFAEFNPEAHTPSAHDLESQFDAQLEEEIRLMKQLEDENLLSSILVTTPREDDSDAKLIDPTTVKYPILEKQQEGNGEEND